MWVISPKASAEFVANREDILAVYQRPYQTVRPVVCLDETFTQLIGEDIDLKTINIENGIEYIDPTLMRKNFKDGISTFDKPTSNPYVTGGWYAYPEEEPTGLPVGLCVVAGAGGHWAWQPKMKMPTDTFKELLRLTHPKFNKVN